MILARSFCRCGGAIAVVVAAVLPARAADAPAPLPPPRLAVVITIDQCRADYLDRFAPYFGPDGFRRLREHGANYIVCHYEHAATKTAVGHATIATGAHPSAHGIVANDWFDPTLGESVNAVSDPSVAIIGAPRQPGRSPRNLMAETIGDQLRARHGAAARIFGIANKDRSAILPAGKSADGAFWLGDNDRFISSTFYYHDGRLPVWVEAINERQPVAAYFGRTWDRLRDADTYLIQGPDGAEGEFSGLGLGRTFPRVIDGGKSAPGKEFSDAFDRSPFALEVIADFVRELVEHEHLGADDVPDLLAIGFSQIDTIGHDYGPDSHEVMDSMLRLDRILGELLRFFDEKVGLNRYVVVISADHGVAPLPERIRATRPTTPAARVDLRDIDRAVTAALVEAFGPAPEGRLWCRRDNQGYRLSPEALAAKQVSLADAARVVQAALLKQEAVSHAFTAANLAVAPTVGDSVATMFRRSQFAPRTPDVVFALRRFHVDRTTTGTNHGTHHEYDTHVPFLWFGPGVPTGRITARVAPTDLAPTLAGLLGVPPPAQSAGRRLF